MRQERLRRRCERIVADLDLPEPLDIQDLCRTLGARRGRPIHLLPMRMPVDRPCGMWVGTAAFDAIFYERDTSPLHQILIICHEIGHLLGGHLASDVLDPDAARLLLPDLDPALVARYLGRTNYSQTQEREAETIASLLVERANPSRPILRWVAPPEVADVLGRLAHSLAHHRRARGG